MQHALSFSLSDTMLRTNTDLRDLPTSSANLDSGVSLQEQPARPTSWGRCVHNLPFRIAPQSVDKPKAVLPAALRLQTSGNDNDDDDVDTFSTSVVMNLDCDDTMSSSTTVLDSGGDDPFERVAPEASLDQSVVHRVTYTPGTPMEFARLRLARWLSRNQDRFTFTWWCNAQTAALLRCSLLELLDGLDGTGSAAALGAVHDDRAGVLQALVELQPDPRKAALLVLDHASFDAVDDFIRRLAPRWGLHIIVLFDDATIIRPDEELTSLVDVLELNLSIHPDRVEQFCELALKWTDSHVGTGHHVAEVNEWSRRTADHIAADVEMQLARISRIADHSAAVMSIAHRAVRELSLSSPYDFVREVLEVKDVLQTWWDTEGGGTSAIVLRANPVAAERRRTSMFGADTRRGSGSVSAFDRFRRRSQGGSNAASARNEKHKQEAAARLRSFVEAVAPLSQRTAGVSPNDVSTAVTCGALLHVLFQCTPSGALDTPGGPGRHLADEEVALAKMSIALPSMFPVALFGRQAVERMILWGIWQDCGGNLVRVSKEVLAGLEIHLLALDEDDDEHNDEREKNGAVWSKHLTECFELAATWIRTADASTTRSRSWRRWKPAICEFFVAEARRRKLRVPLLASLIVPPHTATLDLSMLPTLHEDDRRWTTADAETMLQYATELTVRLRFEDAANMLEGALCVVLKRAGPDGAEVPSGALTATIFALYVQLSDMYGRASIGGVAEQYASRAAKLANAMSNERRDNPARGVARLLLGRISLLLSAQEAKRGTVSDRSKLLSSETGSHMQLNAKLRAEVEAREYVVNASRDFQEVVDAWARVPIALVGEDLALCHRTISAALTHELRDRDSLKAARRALEAAEAHKRRDAVKPTRVSAAEAASTDVDVRDKLDWINANIVKLLKAVRDGRYDEAHALLDVTDAIAYAGVVDTCQPGDRGNYASCFRDEHVPRDARALLSEGRLGGSASTRSGTYRGAVGLVIANGEHATTLTENTRPIPVFYEHLQVYTTLTEATVAKHHGRDWEAASGSTPVTRYIFAPHVLLEHAAPSDMRALDLLARLLECGFDPRACSPHSMETLLHVAVRRNLFLFIGSLLPHPLVDVEYTPPYVLAARRNGLSTVAAVTHEPHPLRNPLCICDNPLTAEQLVTKCHTPLTTFQRYRKSVLEQLVATPARLPGLFAAEAVFSNDVVNIIADTTVCLEHRCIIGQWTPAYSAERALYSVSEDALCRVLARIVTTASEEDLALGYKTIADDELFGMSMPVAAAGNSGILGATHFANMSVDSGGLMLGVSESRGQQSVSMGDSPSHVHLGMQTVSDIGYCLAAVEALTRAATRLIRKDRYDCVRVLVEEFNFNLDWMHWEDAAEFRRVKRARAEEAFRLEVAAEKAARAAALAASC